MSIEWNNVQDVPNVDVECSTDSIFTILILDYDAPSSPFLHMWYQNICVEGKKDIIVPYMSPHPPKGKEHTYEVRVYSQGIRRNKPDKVTRPAFNPLEYGLLDENIIAKGEFVSNGVYLKKVSKK